jgi:hypothetical protein
MLRRAIKLASPRVPHAQGRCLPCLPAFPQTGLAACLVLSVRWRHGNGFDRGGW